MMLTLLILTLSSTGLHAQNPGKIVIAGGMKLTEAVDGTPTLKTVEVIDILSTSNNCYDLQPIPIAFKNGIGGLDAYGFPLVCGLFNDTTSFCQFYNAQSKTWSQSFPINAMQKINAAYTTLYNYFGMGKPFKDFGMMASGGNDLFRTEGTSSKNVAVKSSRMSNWIYKESPFELSLHCMSQMDSTTVVVTGGYKTNPFKDASKSTYFYNLFSEKWTSGPDLVFETAEHGCSFISGKDGKPTAIVAGGINTAKLNAVQIYNRALDKWESGPPLPQALNGFQLLPHPGGGVVTIAGAGFFYLPNIGGTWITLPQKMKTPRTYHTAFWVPDSATSCKEKVPECGSFSSTLFNTVFGRSESDRIIGGTPAAEGAFPYQVALWLSSQTLLFCGGTLISPNYVVTAAHCITNLGNYSVNATDYIKSNKNLEQLYVSVGEYDKTRTGDGETFIKVKRSIVHPAYGLQNSHAADIALLELEVPAKLSPSVQLACLPIRKFVQTDLSSLHLLVSGWGLVKYNPSIVPEKINYAIRGFLPAQTCRNVWTEFNPDMICAGPLNGATVDQMTCRGDSGGPVVIEMNTRITLVGIVSWGPNDCDNEHQPDVYTRVTTYLDWIMDHSDAAKYQIYY